MKNNKLFIPLTVVSFVLAISLILNIFLFVKVKQDSVAEVDVPEEVEMEQEYPISEEFIGLWENKGRFIAFMENGEVYFFTVASGKISRADMEPEHDYISTCKKGHLDENNTLIFTENMSEKYIYENDIYNIDMEQKEATPVMYYYNVFDCDYVADNSVGKRVYKESSEILDVGSSKYMRNDKYSYMLTDEYEPTNACSWDLHDNYLHIVGEDGTVLAKISAVENYDSYRKDDGLWLIFYVDGKAAAQIKSAYDNNKEQRVKLDFSGEFLYEGTLNVMTDVYDSYNHGEFIAIKQDVLPENYDILFKHLK
ncbi:MAG: hypothetical protein K6D38_09305 [Pseudobutyrivibrio sp.]|nr:hypothetical protein [Pseudobutyrivibrio sp.]